MLFRSGETFESHRKARRTIKVRSKSRRKDVARELAYRLYTLCERKKRAADALSYNGLVQSWPEIVRLAQSGSEAAPSQQVLI